MNNFNKVKKAEIHVHLEATITPGLCKKFAKRNNHEILMKCWIKVRIPMG